MHESHIVPRPSDAPPDDASLHTVERWLRTSRTESAYALDPTTGKKVWERHTDGMEVPLSVRDRGRLKGMIFTHNHPRGWDFPERDPRRAGSSFSPHDLHAAASAGLAELRAVSPGYVFMMEPTAAGWPSPPVIGPMYNMIAERQQREATLAHIRGASDIERENADRTHAVWMELAPLMGIVYRRERNYGND